MYVAAAIVAIVGSRLAPVHTECSSEIAFLDFKAGG